MGRNTKTTLVMTMTMRTSSYTNQYRLPTTGEKVTIQGLVSAAQHNGKQGTVVRYDRDSGRYCVQLVEEGEVDGKKKNKKTKQLGVKPSNILLSDDKAISYVLRMVHQKTIC